MFPKNARTLVPLLLITALSAFGEQWLTTKGARPSDRLLGKVNGGTFTTCRGTKVPLSSIPNRVLTEANQTCPRAAIDDISEDQKEQDLIDRLKGN